MTARFTHFEANKDIVSMADRFLKKAAEAGKDPFKYAAAEGEGFTTPGVILAASLAEVKRSYNALALKDYGAVYYHPMIQEFIENLANVASMTNHRGQRQAAIMSAIGQFSICYHMVHHEATGRQVYRVSDGLAMKLAMTELRGLHCEDLKLPHRGLYLEVPECLGLTIMNTDTGWHKVQGVYIAEDNIFVDEVKVREAVNEIKKDKTGEATRRHQEAVKTAQIIINGAREGQKVDQIVTESNRAWRLCIVGAPNTESYDPRDYSLVYYTIGLGAASVDEAVDNLISRVKKAGIETEGSVGAWVKLFRWALNVMTYAATPDAEADHIRGNPEAESIWRRAQNAPKGSTKRERLNDRLREMDQRKRVLLGKSVVVTPALQAMHEHSIGKGEPLQIRTLVSGHWQRYHVGKGRTEITWKYRDPFWRGPDDGLTAESKEHVLR